MNSIGGNIVPKKVINGELMQQANLTIYDHLISVLKSNKFHTDVNGDVFIEKVIDDIVHQKVELIKIMLCDEVLKKAFFQEIEGALIFKPKELIEVLSAERKFLNSKTTYSQSIGLTKKDDFVISSDDVVLAFPFKDCTLVGGQTKDEQKGQENFLHNTINSSEITRLFEPKALTNIKRYSKDKIEDNPTITEEDNLIIKGNNLLALYSLLDKYRGKVKLIYIDPPYNTGNDSFGYNDNFNHSTWLTFMKNRLEVAREFLREDGVIFVSIDDNEQAYLKVLMDEVFGRENFVANFVWEHRKSSQNDIDVSLSHNYTLCFGVNRTKLKLNPLVANISKFSNPDNDPRGAWVADPFDAPNIRENLSYEIINPNTGEKYLPPKGRHWRFSKEKYEEAFRDNRILFGKTGKSRPQFKRFQFEAESKGENSFTIWDDTGTATEATKELMKLFDGEKIFGTPKPERLLERIIHLSTQPNDLVMDFHLGSGTTTAVAHKMGRRYIGIEQMDYIEDIAVERMKKVIDGEQGGISKAVEWQGGGDFVYMELKKIDEFQNIEPSEDDKLNKIKMKLCVEMEYLPYSEIEDKTYKIPPKEKEANHQFYGDDDA